jgi:antitoxin StbD
VPEEASLQEEPRYATMDEVMESIKKRRETNQPVLDYLKDK